MNTEDVKPDEVPSVPNRLDAMFKRQAELMEKYHHIESENGLLLTSECPVSLHDRFGQARLKDFAWRVMEEIAEASDAAISKGWTSSHAREEIADAAHFLIEFCLIAGMGSDELLTRAKVLVEHPRDDLEALFEYTNVYAETNDEQASVEETIVKLLTHMGMTCHLLKNKPWKQSHVLTDYNEFYDRLAQTFLRFIWVCIAVGMWDGDLYDLYYRKSKVNQFRQETQY